MIENGEQKQKDAIEKLKTLGDFVEEVEPIQLFQSTVDDEFADLIPEAKRVIFLNF